MGIVLNTNADSVQAHNNTQAASRATQPQRVPERAPPPSRREVAAEQVQLAQRRRVSEEAKIRNADAAIEASRLSREQIREQAAAARRAHRSDELRDAANSVR